MNEREGLCPSVDRFHPAGEFHCILPENHEGRCTTGTVRGKKPHTWMRLSEMLRTQYQAEYVPSTEGGPAIRRKGREKDV